jgi:hypothetical protein
MRWLQRVPPPQPRSPSFIESHSPKLGRPSSRQPHSHARPMHACVHKERHVGLIAFQHPLNTREHPLWMGKSAIPAPNLHTYLKQNWYSPGSSVLKLNEPVCWPRSLCMTLSPKITSMSMSKRPP